MDLISKIYGHISDNNLKLQEVLYLVFNADTDDPLISQIKLVFNKDYHVLIEAVGNDDTLKLSNDNFKFDQDLNEKVLDVSDSEPWNRCISKGILNIWELTNQQGYEDCIQIEFGNTILDDTTILQLKVVGSNIKLLKLTQMKIMK